MAHIRLGDEYFNVAVDGPREAPVAILSNSLGTDLRMWDPLMPELTKHFRVIRYDSRGHGASPADEGPYTIEKLGRDAVAILDKLGVDKAHWVGLSMGGMVGQWVLAHSGGRINRAVFANTAAHMEDSDFWEKRAQAAKDGGMLALADGIVERWLSAGFAAENPELVQMIKDMVANTPAHGYAACCIAIRNMDLRPSLRAIRKPLLVITGDQDSATPAAEGRMIAQSVAGARLLALDAMHMSAVEQADAFAAAVVAFLSGRAVGDEPPPADHAAESRPPPRRRAPKASAAKPLQGETTKAASPDEPPEAEPPTPETKKAPAKKAVKKSARKPAKTPARKAAAKKAAKKSTKKAAKKSAKKPMKKAAKKRTTGGVRKPAKTAAKRAAKKTRRAAARRRTR